jgi:hypothetical protein
MLQVLLASGMSSDGASAILVRFAASRSSPIQSRNFLTSGASGGSVTEQTQQGTISHRQAARLNNTTTASVVSASTGQVMSSRDAWSKFTCSLSIHTHDWRLVHSTTSGMPTWKHILRHETPRLRSPWQPTSAANQPLQTRGYGRKGGRSKPNQRKGLFIRQFTVARRATITSSCRQLSTQEEVALYNQLLPKHTKGSKIKLRNAQGMMKCPGFSTTIW